jgi:hypothetical protein
VLTTQCLQARIIASISALLSMEMVFICSIFLQKY